MIFQDTPDEPDSCFIQNSIAWKTWAPEHFIAFHHAATLQIGNKNNCPNTNNNKNNLVNSSTVQIDDTFQFQLIN